VGERSRRDPSKYGVKNVYGDLGQIFARAPWPTAVCAAMMGQLVRGLGADHVVWGSDAIWTGSPQWQIEALRRLEIPDDMQKKYGLKPLGPADGPVKNAIFGENSAPSLQVREADRAGDRSPRRDEEGVREGRRGPQQPALRVRRPVAWLNSRRAGGRRMA